LHHNRKQRYKGKLTAQSRMRAAEDASSKEVATASDAAAVGSHQAVLFPSNSVEWF
jgi:hypothetical protein